VCIENVKGILVITDKTLCKKILESEEAAKSISEAGSFMFGNFDLIKKAT